MKSRAYDTMMGGFRTTQWELIAKATEPQGQEREEALEELCRIYWPAVYTYIRRKGFSPVDAQDLTQEFLFHLVKGEMLNEVQAEKGRFRSYLAVCCNHHISNHRDASQTLKRGGGIQFQSLDFESAELAYEAALVDDVNPEKEFTRRWISVLLGRVMAQLEEDYAEDGKEALFTALEPALTGSKQELSYRELAAQMKTTEANVQVMVHRLRRKFSDILREEIKSTLLDPSELDEELRYLITSLS